MQVATLFLPECICLMTVALKKFMTRKNSVCCYSSIDATSNFNDRLGRFVSDAPKKYANCVTKKVTVNEKPTLVFFAVDRIKAGTELRFDYGGENLPWRDVSIILSCRLLIMKVKRLHIN